MKLNYFKALGLLLVGLLTLPAVAQSQGPTSEPTILIENGFFGKNIKTFNWDVNTSVSQLPKLLDLPSDYSFEQIGEKEDHYGMTHTSFQQYYKGYPIENHLTFIHSKAGKVISINGYTHKVEEISVAPTFTEDQTYQIALQAMNAEELLSEYPVEMVITESPVTKNLRLTYKIRLDVLYPLLDMAYVYVDAQTGEVLHQRPLINFANVPGSGATLYYGNRDITVDSHNGNYRLRESDRNIQTFDASHATSFDTNGVNDAYDYFNSSPDFDGIATLTEFYVESISEDWWEDPLSIGDPIPNLYLRIIDANGMEIYRTDFLEETNVPLTFENINFQLSNPPYSVELWNKIIQGNDNYGGSYDLNMIENTHDWSGNGNNGTYTIEQKINPALDVHWGMEQTIDFFQEVFGRNSFDDEGSLIRNYVNPNTSAFSNYGFPNNAASFQSPYNFILYGMGNGTALDPLVELDIIGHEFSHLVISKNGNGGLYSQGEPGALNESISDIFGISIKFRALQAEANWVIGDYCWLNGSGLRNMQNPKDPTANATQPHTYEGEFWIDPSSTYDNGGVHFNSGVSNYWFYLITEGGSGVNDNQDNYDVNGLGFDTSLPIVYQTLVNYVTPNTKFIPFHRASLQATADLYDLPSEAYTSVARAWYAVGLANNPDQFCSGTEILTEENGEFYDGSGAEDYANNSNCSWLIQPQNAESITLTFSEFSTQEDTDFVIVYDGADSSGLVLGSFSGNELPAELTAYSGSMFVEFYTDHQEVDSGWSASYSAVLGVEKPTLKQHIRIYPNPSNGIFHITYGANQSVNLQVFDINGKMVAPPKTIENGHNIIDLTQLNPGIYFGEFMVGNVRYVEKLIVR